MATQFEKLLEEMGLSMFNFDDLNFDDFKVEDYYQPNISKTDEQYLFEFPLLGVAKEDLKVSIEDDTLIIKVKSEKEEKEYIKKGFKSVDDLTKKYSLSKMKNIDYDNITSSMENGVLSIIFKIQEGSKKDINIQ